MRDEKECNVYWGKLTDYDQQIKIIACKSGSIFKSIELFSEKSMHIEKKNIEFMCQESNLKIYLYIIQADEKCYIDNGKMIYVYIAKHYLFSTHIITKNKLKAINEMIVVKTENPVSISMNGRRVAKYNHRLRNNARRLLEGNIEQLSRIPLKIFIVKSLTSKDYMCINGELIGNLTSNYNVMANFNCYYHQLIIGKIVKPKYLIYKGESTRIFAVNNNSSINDYSAIPIGRIFEVSSSYEKFLKKYMYNQKVLNNNIVHIGKAKTENNYDFIVKYEYVVKYLRSNYTVSNDICVCYGIRNEINNLMKLYRNHWRTWEFKIDKANNIQLIAIVLLLYQNGLLGNKKLPKFANCMDEVLSLENLIQISQHLTELRNAYSHSNKIPKNNASKALHELLSEIYILLIYKQLSLDIIRIDIDEFYDHVSLNSDYSKEMELYKTVQI